MNILLSFTGFHDPFAPSAVDGEMEAGPVLSVLAERAFDLVCLFSTPRLAGISRQTKKEIEARRKATEVEVIDVPLKDPTNYLGILRQLRTNFRRISSAHPDARYAISVSSVNWGSVCNCSFLFDTANQPVLLPAWLAVSESNIPAVFTTSWREETAGGRFFWMTTTGDFFSKLFRKLAGAPAGAFTPGC